VRLFNADRSLDAVSIKMQMTLQRAKLLSTSKDRLRNKEYSNEKNIGIHTNPFDFMWRKPFCTTAHKPKYFQADG